MSACLKELATAHIVVANERTLFWMHKHFLKRKGQYFINTWHGALGIKKTGQDRGDLTEGEIERIEIDSRNVDFITSNGIYTSDLYKRIFFGYGRILEIGLPRNDIFFFPHDNKIHHYLRVPEDVRFVLYAPTYREDGGIDWCNIAPEQCCDALAKRFGGKWLFLSRMHHMLRTQVPGKGIDVSDYPDIQELMVESDVVITDYSSCIYDFVLTRKPGFIYAKDRAIYENARGLYYPLSETPFPIAENMEQLVHNIENFDESRYKDSVQSFLTGKGCREDGHAAEKTAKIIKAVLEDREIDFKEIVPAVFQ